MVTGLVLDNISLAQHRKFTEPTNPFSGARTGDIMSSKSRFLRFPNFRHHGNRGWFETDFACAVEFSDPSPKKNRLVRQSGTYLVGELYQIFVTKNCDYNGC